MQKNIVLMKGDGIGPEIVDAALLVLNKTAQKYQHEFTYEEALIGGASYDACGVPLTQETIEKCNAADAVLLGAVGGPKWDALPVPLRPEQGLLAIRKAMGLFANLRPAYLFKELASACPIKAELIANGIDILMVRELTGGVYFGEHTTETKANGKQYAEDKMGYHEEEIERIGFVAFEMAMKRNKNLVSVDKANVLDTSRLWRKVMHRLKEEYPEVEYRDMLVDNTAMQLVANPGQFDVIVTENMFGDILSDEASMVVGSIGMLPSASLGLGSKGLYEPSHGSAPDIAGKDIANPLATILSAAMMLRYSFDLPEEASAIEDAINKTLAEGYRTKDIMSEGCKQVGCKQMAEKIVEKI